MTTNKIYHGTPNNINGLCLSKAVDNNQHEFYGAAIYFSSNFHVAKGYGRNIFELAVDDSDFVVLDGKRTVIRKLAFEIESLIAEGKNIIVRNVCDNTLYGIDCITVAFCDNTQSDKYIYLSKYFLNQRYKKITDELRAMIAQAKDAGIALDTYNGYISNPYNISEEQAKHLNEIGFEVKKCMCTVPESADTYIITNQSLLNDAKLIVG